MTLEIKARTPALQVGQPKADGPLGVGISNAELLAEFRASQGVAPRALENAAVLQKALGVRPDLALNRDVGSILNIAAVRMHESGLIKPWGKN